MRRMTQFARCRLRDRRGLSARLALPDFAVNSDAGLVEIAVVDDAGNEQHAVDAAIAAIVAQRDPPSGAERGAGPSLAAK